MAEVHTESFLGYGNNNTPKYITRSEKKSEGEETG